MNLRDLALGLAWTGMLVSIACSSHPRSEVGRLPKSLSRGEAKIDDRYLLEIDTTRVRLTKEYLQLHNPHFSNLLAAPDTPESISFEPRMIVIHYTAIPTLEETINYFTSPRIEGGRELIQRNGHLNVGVQFVVDRDGSIYRLYPETIVSRHVIGLNHVSIGIENIGDGDLGDSTADYPLTIRQLQANVALIKYLKGRHPGIEFLIGHHEYRDVEATSHPANNLFFEQYPTYRTEKSDPGERFMKRLRRSLQR